MNITFCNHRSVSFAFAICAIFVSNPVVGDELGQATRAAIEKVAPSTVRIRVIGSSGGDELEVASQVTTGVVISENGEILTSVFGFGGQPAAIFVEDSKGDRVAASVVATDHLRKLVLLKCQEGTFVPATFNQERWPAIGAYCVAAGRLYAGPLPAASVGVVSATRRIHGIALQTDAKISPVNYGGPLLNLDGEVLGVLVPLSPRDSGEGINAAVKWYDSGIGFAIPASDALQVAAKLSNGKDRSRGILGVDFSTRNPLASDFTIKVLHPDSPASKAGIKKGDKITTVNGVDVSRFGLFESVLKSSYAGDRLALTVERDSKEIDIEAQLVDRLKPVLPGYVGLTVISTENNKKTDGTAVIVLPDSPLAKLQLSGTILLQKIDDAEVNSASKLRKALRSVRVGQKLQIDYRTPDSNATETVSVVAERRPNSIPPFEDSMVSEVFGAASDSDWKRSEEDFEETGKVWMYAPASKEVKNLGIIVLLSDSQTAREVIAKRWGKICRQHNLMVIVPSNTEGSGLTREDSEFITQAVKLALADRNIDMRRAVLVAGKPQAELCGEILLNTQQKLFRSAVFVETWPRIAGIPASVIANRSPSFLILNGIVQSRSAQALRAQAVKHISEAGASVIESEVFGSTSAESAIANWVFSLMAL